MDVKDIKNIMNKHGVYPDEACRTCRGSGIKSNPFYLCCCIRGAASPKPNRADCSAAFMEVTEYLQKAAENGQANTQHSETE